MEVRIPFVLNWRSISDISWEPFSATGDREHCLNAGMVRHVLLFLSLWS